MGRLRRAFVAAGAGGLGTAALVAWALWKYPALANASDHDEIPWTLTLSSAGLLLLLGIGFLLACLPRRWRRTAALSLVGALFGLGTLFVVYPPITRNLWDWPLGSFLWSWMYWRHPDDRFTELVCQVEYDDRGLVARTYTGREWVWDAHDGRILERHGAGHVAWPIWSYPNLPPRDLPVESIRAGIPLEAFTNNRPYVMTPRIGRGRNYYHPTSGWCLGPPSYALFYRTADAKLVRSLGSPGSTQLSPDGNRVLVEELLQLPVSLLYGAPMPLTLPRESGYRALLYDLRLDRLAWERWLPAPPGIRGHRVSFSRTGRYVTCDRLLLDTETGRTIGRFEGRPDDWILEDTWAVVTNEDGASRLVRVPDFTVAGQCTGLRAREWAFRSDGKEIAMPMRHRVRVFTFPELEPVRTLLITSPDWVLERACPVGAFAGLAFWLAGLLLSSGSRRWNGDVPEFRASTFGRRVVLICFISLPAAALLASWLPVRLSDSLGCISVVGVGALLVPTAAASSRLMWGKVLLVLAVLVLPAVSMLWAMERATRRYGATAVSDPGLLDRRWVVDPVRRCVVSLDGDKEVAWLGVRSSHCLRYELEGETLRGRWGQLLLEWSTRDWSLRRALIEPVASPRSAWRYLNCGVPLGDRIVPTLPIWKISLFGVKDVRAFEDGRILFAIEEERWTGVYASSMARVRLLEIPLHALLAALILATALSRLSRA